MNTISCTVVVAAALSVGGCSFDEAGSSPGAAPCRSLSGATAISAIAPASGSAPGPNGHVLRLNRVVDGFDALPSPSNDYAGRHFNAPCGCVALLRGSKVDAVKPYAFEDAGVTFPFALTPGRRTYVAAYLPQWDSRGCPAACAGEGARDTAEVYFSGSITVTVLAEPGLDCNER